MDVTQLAFNALIGIERVQADGALLQLPAHARYLNHLGTVHASALLALAEASSGEFLVRYFDSSDGVVPVVRRFEAKFRKPARGAVISSASVAPDVLAQLDSELSTRGRALVTISVELHDESGAHALSATVEWFLQVSVGKLRKGLTRHGSQGRKAGRKIRN